MYVCIVSFSESFYQWMRWRLMQTHHCLIHFFNLVLLAFAATSLRRVVLFYCTWWVSCLFCIILPHALFSLFLFLLMPNHRSHQKQNKKKEKENSYSDTNNLTTDPSCPHFSFVYTLDHLLFLLLTAFLLLAKFKSETYSPGCDS